MGELLCLDLVQVEESLEVLPVPGGETLEVPLYLDSAPEMQMKLELYQVQLDIHWV